MYARVVLEVGESVLFREVSILSAWVEGSTDVK